MKLKIEVLKVFTLEFEMESEKNKEKKDEKDSKDSNNTATTGSDKK